jgi:hypothetical protein
MTSCLYLDTARLGRMCPEAQAADRDFARFAGDEGCSLYFEPAPIDSTGGTGLYCGEQDMFCFLIDPHGWTEIGGETFAPGFFLWNSEVGRRSLGVETSWYQAVCQNHIGPRRRRRLPPRAVLAGRVTNCCWLVAFGGVPVPNCTAPLTAAGAMQRTEG